MITNLTTMANNTKVDFDFDAFFNSFLEVKKGENFSPVAQRKMGSAQLNNIAITGEFETDFDASNDYSDDGMMYITTRRNSSGKALAHCGYGIALRPSSVGAGGGSEITGIADNGDGTFNISIQDSSSFSAGISYLETEAGAVAFEVGSVAEGVLNNCLIPTNITPSIGGDVILAAHNVFIIDNDLVGSDIYNNNQIEFENGSVLSYISSASVEVKANTLYYFSLTISSNNSVSFRISESKDNLDSVPEAVTSGAYIPLSSYLETPDMDAFGIGIINTRGHKWYFDNIHIGSLSLEYPVVLFEMDVSTLPDNFRGYVRGMGIGYADGTITYGLRLMAWNGTQWDEVASNDYDTMLEASNAVSITKEMTKSIYSISGVVKFACIPVAPSGPTGDKKASITIDYFTVKASTNNAMHIGGCSDVYVNDSYLQEDSVEVAVGDTRLAEFGGDRAVVWVESVETISSENIPLIEGVDYKWSVGDENNRNSTKAGNRIVFSSGITGSVLINYIYSPYAYNAQALSNDENYSFKGHDTLIKHMNLHLLDIEGDVSKEILSEYLLNSDRESDGSKILDWDSIRRYAEASLNVSSFKISAYTRNGSLITKTHIKTSGDQIKIDKVSAFWVRS